MRRCTQLVRVLVLGLVLAGLGTWVAAAEPAGVMLRVKVRPTPEQPVQIHWRTGGEGLGGHVTSGSILLASSAAPPGSPGMKGAGKSAATKDDFAADAFDELLFDAGATPTVANDDNELFLRPDTWTVPNPISKLPRGFVTFTFRGLNGPIQSVEAEFEFSFDGKVLKTIVERGVQGPTVGMKLPRGGPADEGWIDQLLGLQGYVEQRARSLEGLPWGGGPLPTRFTFITDSNGFGRGAGYGIRHTNPDILAIEARVLRQLGINSLRGGYEVLKPALTADPTYGPIFGRRREVHTMGYPIISMGLSDGNQIKRNLPAGAGCPFYPGTDERAREAARAAVRKLIEQADGAQEMWGLTVDEIGSVFDQTPEGKPHMSVCPHCAQGFRSWLKSQGMTPQDFGRQSWEEIRPNLYPNAELWADVEARMVAAETRNKQQAASQMSLEAGVTSREAGEDLVILPAAGAARAAAGHVDLDSVNEEDAANEAAQAGASAQEKESDAQALARARGDHLMKYWSHRFNCWASARLFASLREECDAANAAKRQALASGGDAAVAGQPWVYTFALRGCTFISGGHSLDFFNFYRESDTGFAYETSNRDARIWQWDSMMGDVARSLERMRGLPFCIYIKPHRGAPIQRLLASVGRGAELIFWYTYGPDYAKGDSFSSRESYLHDVSRAVHLVGAAEEVLYGAQWSEPARVAHVRTRTAEKFSTALDWENGKWVYSALSHAHVPVDVIDEEMVIADDLSGYRAIYISGRHLRQAAAAKLVEYVRQGGSLYIDGGGAMFDEAGAPLELLYPVLGVNQRTAFVEWAQTKRYGATSLQPITPLTDSKPPKPEAAHVAADSTAAGDMLSGAFDLVAGREVLEPTNAARVLARFGDGEPAALVNEYGQGRAVSVGFYAGLEYASPIIAKADYDVTRDLTADRRSFVAGPALAVTQPVVDASAPLIEGLLVRHPESGRQAVLLMNWAYNAGKALRTFENVTLRIRTDQPVQKVRSIWHNAEVPILGREGQWLQLQLPLVEEGDVLLLE